MKHFYCYFSVFILFFFLSQCSKNKNPETQNKEKINQIIANSSSRDLNDIKKDGVLKALVVYSSTSYFLYRGRPMGFEYEILQRLAKHLDVKLEITVSDDLDNQFKILNSGDVDIIAHGMTITNQRKNEVDFTDYLYLTKQVLVQKKPDNYRKMSWSSLQNHVIDDPLDLIGDTVSIRKNSAYVERILSLANEIGGTIYIDTLSSKLSTGEIIDKVVKGEIKYTIADENLAKINASSNPILKIDVPISLSQRIAWVLRKKSSNLKKVVNEWIAAERKKTDYYVIYNKYFKNKRLFKRRIKSDYYSLKNNQISEYDDLIKKYTKKLGWDWRLLAAQVYQESKFDPDAKSWAGAKGLLQIMPATAKELGVTDVNDPEQSLRGGTTYLSQIYDRFTDIPNEIDRIKFTLAAYNCGYAHLRDAQHLADFNKLNPLVWEDNVDKMLLALRFPKNFNKDFIKYGYVRGTEPFIYVEQIFDRFQHYKQFIDEEE